MKILIYGAGTVGATYGWQLSGIGHDITILVRNGQKDGIEQNGINIHCTDLRGGQKQIIETVFRPKVIENLSADNDFDYIIVSVNTIQLEQVLPTLSQSAGKANVIFFQNNWNSFDKIKSMLSDKQYFFGFPFIVGGGKEENRINSVISGMKYSNTTLGEINGETTPRLQKIAEAFGKANLNPVISNQIKPWLIAHYVVAAGLAAGIVTAGDTKNFVKNTTVMKQTMKAIKEGFKVCVKMGIDPKKDKSNKLYNLPSFIAVPIARKIFSNEAFGLMFAGHLKHSPDEIQKMASDILTKGKELGVEMPTMESLQKTMETRLK